MAKESTLADKTGVVVFARMVITFIELATVIFLVRLLTTTDWAIVSFLLLVYETAKYFATLGFPDSVFYFFGRLAKNARKAFAFQTSAILGITALIAATVMLLLNFFLDGFLSGWDTENIKVAQDLLPLMALIALIEIPTWPVGNLMLAADRQKDSSWYQLMNSVLTFAAMIGPLVLGHSIYVAIWCLLGYSIIRFIVSFIWLWKILPPMLERTNSGLVREQIKFAVPVGFSALVHRINKYVDKFIVAFLLLETDLAQYNVGAQEIPLVRVIPFAVGSVLISRFVSLNIEDKKQELIELWHKGIEKVSLIVIPMAILFIVMAEEFITLLFTDTYLPAAIPFMIYSSIILIRVTHYGSVLQAFGDTKNIMRLSINLLSWNIVLSIPMTMYFGIAGTASATVLANFINWFMTLNVIGKHMQIAWYKVIPFPFYLKVLAISCFIGINISLLNYILPNHHPGLGITWMTFIMIIGFSTIGTRFGVISKSDWAQLKKWAKLKFLF